MVFTNKKKFVDSLASGLVSVTYFSCAQCPILTIIGYLQTNANNMNAKLNTSMPNCELQISSISTTTYIDMYAH